MNSITVSPASLKQIKGQELKPVILPVRVYYRNMEHRFNFYLNDVNNKPVRLMNKQLKSGVVVDHPKSIRYSSLISFARRRMRLYANEYFSKRIPFNRHELKSKVHESILTDFETEFTETLDDQKVSVETEFYGEIKVDKNVYKVFKSTDFSTEPEVDRDGNIDFNDWDKEDFETILVSEQSIHEKEQENIKRLSYPTSERLKRGYFDSNNIFELFASIKYRDDLDDTYNKIIIRLYEFMFYKNPDKHISRLNTEWVNEFFKFLWNEGYTSINTRSFDPLKFDGSILEGKKKKKYEPQAFHKLCEVFQTVANKLLPQDILNQINFSKIDLEEICGEKKLKKGTHLEEHLTKEEFDTLFFYQFNSKLNDHYQQVFTSHYEKGSIQINCADLALARDLFCLQTMAGGLRSYNDLMTLRFDRAGKQLAFNAEKTDDLLQNPLNVYTKIIAEDYGYNLPRMRFQRSHNSLTDIYRALLKTIAEIIPLGRQIKVKKKLIPINRIFVPKFGRKTFGQILYDEYGIHPDDISIFTGHKIKNENVLVSNYLNTQSPKKKKSIFDKIKLPKGESIKTNRKCI